MFSGIEKGCIGNKWINRNFVPGQILILPPLNDCMVADISLISICMSFIIFSISTFSLSYSLNFSNINVIVLFNSNSCCSPLIWLFLVSSVLLKISIIDFSTFFIQLTKMATQSEEDNPFAKGLYFVNHSKYLHVAIWITYICWGIVKFTFFTTSSKILLYNYFKSNPNLIW